MYLNFNTGILTDDHTIALETKEYAVFWEGVPFVKGIPSGEESIRRFLEHISEGGIEKACKHLCGGFTCFVYDKILNRYYAFNDNNGLSRCYYNKDSISSSFLKLAGRMNLKLDNLNPFSVLEFVHAGRLFGQPPLFSNIGFIGPETMAVVSKPGVKLVPKTLVYPSGCHSPEKTFIENLD